MATFDKANTAAAARGMYIDKQQYQAMEQKLYRAVECRLEESGVMSALKAQLRDASEAAAGLQGLLEAQQKVAEAYRGEATRSLAKLSQIESEQQPLQQSLEAFRQQEASARAAMALEMQQQQAQLQAALSQSLQAQSSESLSDVSRGLEELRAELRTARQREEEQRLALHAARAVVQ